ncbi:hypothetical protein M409DRAFT_29324 [Zasmidium cellare ATCC 36951]|uniref:Uncharacterized protein n=1 Tax=Zasmidium cellare ATCC 36951 TaxID=1080233 RepID=A0A6A6BZL5_ZASCE|nr:uncharacterized protein M409DRAFT_29324 [Zasmidium cellare ATCC 36951]KAF2160234.1 hypothetical protein M409DRAFT_29324 [Zasmidium cellare ATCC 36951]
MQALLHSDLRPKDLSSAADSWLWNLDIDKVLQDPDTFVACQAMFTNLEHLAVGISRLHDLSDYAGLWASASNLVSLTLWTQDSNLLRNVVAKAVFPSLCVLKLCGVSIPLADLHTIVQGLVERNPALQQLHLHGVVLLFCESFVNQADNETGGAGTVADFRKGFSWVTEENLLGNALRKLLGLSGEYIEVRLDLRDFHRVWHRRVPIEHG